MEKSVYTKSKIIRAFAVSLALLALIFFVLPWSQIWQISFLFNYLFGILSYWLFLPAFLFFAILLFIRGEKEKKVLSWRIYLGFFLALIGASLILGCISSLKLPNLSELYPRMHDTFSKKAGLIDIVDGGGIIYSGLASWINKAGPALTITLAIVFLLSGLFLLFYVHIMRFINFLSVKAGASRAKKESEASVKKMEEERQAELEAYVAKNRPIEFKESESIPSVGAEAEPQIPFDGKIITSRTQSVSDQGENISVIPVEREPVVPLGTILSDLEIPHNGLREAVFDPDDKGYQEEAIPLVPKSNDQSKKNVFENAPSNEISFESLQKSEQEITNMPEVEEEERAYEEKDEPEPFLDIVKEENKASEKTEPIEQEQEESIILNEKAPIEEEPQEEEMSIKPIVVPKVMAEKSVMAQAPIEEKVKEPEPSEEEKMGIMPAKERPDYRFPSVSLLKEYKIDPEIERQNQIECDQKAAVINQTFFDLNAGAQVVSYTVGPSVTRYDVMADKNVSVSTIQRYVKDISVRLGGVRARFEEVVLGKTTSGLEIANEKTSTVSLKRMVESLPTGEDNNLCIPFGVNISGECIYSDLSKFPHMLIAGTSGSGKSIFAHGVLASLIMRNRPEDLKLVLVDPKRVEMTKYKDLPHLLCPIIKEPSEAKVALDKLIDEMESRLMMFDFAGVRDIRSYNGRYCPKAGAEKIPFIIVFIDEYADLADTCKNIGESVVRLAQKARAAGIHLVIATQRPSVNVITGTIKANLNVRVALTVASSIDSQTILGRSGAEDLNGHGDMLVDCSLVSRSGFVRCQGCYVDDDELEAITSFIKSQQEAVYDPRFLDLVDHQAEAKAKAEAEPQISRADLKAAESESLYERIKRDVMMQEYTSISKIQRTYGVGFPRAGKIFQQLKEDGIVAEAESQACAKGSRVLIHDESLLSDGSEDFDGDND